MKKLVLGILLVGNSHLLFSQKLLTKTGTTTFEASMPSFEEIKATNNASTSVLNTTNGEVAAVVQMMGFKFKSALMEEHFNENYMESSNYPKATFKGVIRNFNQIKDTGGKATIEGVLEMHGKKKSISSIGQLNIKGTSYVLTGFFNVKSQDFAIEIPNLVSKKIAKDIKINYNYQLK